MNTYVRGFVCNAAKPEAARLKPRIANVILSNQSRRRLPGRIRKCGQGPSRRGVRTAALDISAAPIKQLCLLIFKTVKVRSRTTGPIAFLLRQMPERFVSPSGPLKGIYGQLYRIPKPFMMDIGNCRSLDIQSRVWSGSPNMALSISEKREDDSLLLSKLDLVLPVVLYPRVDAVRALGLKWEVEMRKSGWAARSRCKELQCDWADDISE